MARTQYARDMISNFQRRLAIEQLFTELKRRSSAEATVVVQRLSNINRQTSAGRNVG